MISDIEYINMLKSIPDGLRLTNGNCGIFAITLQRLFGEGRTVGVKETDDHNDIWMVHVLLKIGDKYYDGKGIWTKQDVILKYKDCFGHFEDVDEDMIMDCTSWQMVPDEMKGIIESYVHKE